MICCSQSCLPKSRRETCIIDFFFCHPLLPENNLPSFCKLLGLPAAPSSQACRLKLERNQLEMLHWAPVKATSHTCARWAWLKTTGGFNTKNTLENNEGSGVASKLHDGDRKSKRGREGRRKRLLVQESGRERERVFADRATPVAGSLIWLALGQSISHNMCNVCALLRSSTWQDQSYSFPSPPLSSLLFLATHSALFLVPNKCIAPSIHCEREATVLSQTSKPATMHQLSLLSSNRSSLPRP